MYINNIKITSFRNFESAFLEFSRGINLFSGRNGSGKTNLLEAIFVLLLGRSQRGAPDAVMLRESDQYYRVEGSLDFEGNLKTGAIAYQKGGRKKITLDGAAVRISDLFQNNVAVSAAPEDIEIIAGAPSGRREFMDIYISQARSEYLSTLTRYHKALAQKNAFLKKENNRMETPFDELLVEYGAAVMNMRRSFLKDISAPAAGHYEKISDGQDFEIVYAPSVPFEEGADVEKIKSSFRRKLKKYYDRERIMQTSLVGPHRDDIGLAIEKFPARSHGSQGELRTAAVCLKLAVYEFLREARKSVPVVLLDEIFAELDDHRRDMLVDLFAAYGQVFLTTAMEVPGRLREGAEIFKIDNGRIIT